MSKIVPKLTWSSSKEDLVEKFYRPALTDAVLYQRKAGYFSSSAFAEISKEIIDLIKKGGRMQLITSPNLSTFDKSALEKSVTDSVEDREKMFSDLFFEDLVNDPSGTKQHFAKLMAYMLTNQIDGKPQLEIKIALTNDGQGIFHEKSGIIHHSDGGMISFTGSINETMSGWSKNTENFVAFFSWIDNKEKEQAREVEQEFNDIWNQNNSNVQLFDLPDAVNTHLLKISPKSTREYQDTFKEVCDIIDGKNKSEEKSDDGQSKEKGLRQYQKDAINAWMENDSRGIFSMATGTGKTFTAFGCINKLQTSKDRLITIIACPMTHLVEQWKTQLKNYNKNVQDDLKIVSDQNIVIYGEKKWRGKLDDLVDEFNRKLMGSKQYTMKNILVFVTHETANNSEFIEKIMSFKDTKLFLIVDEVHNVGTVAKQRSLRDEYDYRLGLSATPKRHYDEEGTVRIFDYFHDEVFTYNLRQAIKEKHLCEYYYWPIYVELTNEEMSKYDELTKKIAAKLGAKKYLTTSDDDDRNDPSNKRADLIANAENKMKILENLCDEKQWKLNQTLIYCTSNQHPLHPTKDTQLEKVNELLSDHHVTIKSVTYRDPTKSRINILDNLATGHYNCLTAVKCLDEGMDIPSIETAIMMASSGNPKQYVQRRGRVLRPSPKTRKKWAVIYDILVKPPLDSSKDTRERKLVAKELLRHKEFASTAKNEQKAIDIIKDIAEEYDIDLKKLSYDYIQNL
jgi:superfamily II DNA or RNA helicase